MNKGINSFRSKRKTHSLCISEFRSRELVGNWQYLTLRQLGKTRMPEQGESITRQQLEFAALSILREILLTNSIETGLVETALKRASQEIKLHHGSSLEILKQLPTAILIDGIERLSWLRGSLGERLIARDISAIHYSLAEKRIVTTAGAGSYDFEEMQPPIEHAYVYGWLRKITDAEVYTSGFLSGCGGIGMLIEKANVFDFDLSRDQIFKIETTLIEQIRGGLSETFADSYIQVNFSIVRTADKNRGCMRIDAMCWEDTNGVPSHPRPLTLYYYGDPDMRGNAAKNPECGLAS